MGSLPGAVLVERLTLEIADLDVVEERLLLERDVASGKCDRRRFPGAPESRVHAELDRDVRQLLTQQARLVAALLREHDRDRRIPVDPILEIERRLAVAGDHV